MKKKTLFAPIFLLGITVSAQVGINTETPQSTLDVRSKTADTTTGIATIVSPDDGILVPRIASFGSVNGITDGQLVYLTANVIGTGTVANPQYKKGFHYWNAPNTTWTPIDTDTGGAATNDDWHLIGNAGTSSATNFIGTTDNQDFVVKRNNIFSGLIGVENTSWGNNSFNTTGTGVRNTAIGALAVTSNTVGYGNTGVGYNAITANTTGNNNTALGINTLLANTTGENNTAVGPYALQANTTGDDNTAVGNALQSNTTARVNTAVEQLLLGLLLQEEQILL